MFQTSEHASPTANDRWLIEPMVELAALLKEQTTWTWLHSGRVARYAVAMGKKLELDRPTMLALHCAGLLHDIGKVSIPADLLNKSTALSRDEWYAITKHSMISSLMLKAQELPRRVIAITQSHHEWYDGTGYPLGLEGNAIPLGARILSLADAYDAMSNERPYRPALSPEEIAGEIVKGSGTQFDPALVRELLPFLAGTPLNTLPGRVLRVVSDDPMLYRELWFAAYPLGWELEIWPQVWATDYPPELVKPAALADNLAPDLTVIDGRSLRRVPEGTLDKLPGSVLWVDPLDGEEPALYRPLSLEAVLHYLDFQPATDSADDLAEPIRVLLADPYHLFRQGLRRLLDHMPEVRVIAEVKSPKEYRKARDTLNYQVAIVASDLLEGTRSTVPLTDDSRLQNEEAGIGANETRPTIVLVADEDLDEIVSQPSRSEQDLLARRVFIHRGAPAEVLMDAMRLILGQAATPIAGEQHG